MSEKQFVHPYIPNSEPRVKRQLLDFIGMESSEGIYKEIPERLRFHGEMQLPEPLISEYSLQRHVEGLLAKNRNAKTNIGFLGGGTWNHYVPCLLYTSTVSIVDKHCTTGCICAIDEITNIRVISTNRNFFNFLSAGRHVHINGCLLYTSRCV